MTIWLVLDGTNYPIAAFDNYAAATAYVAQRYKIGATTILITLRVQS